MWQLQFVFRPPPPKSFATTLDKITTSTSTTTTTITTTTSATTPPDTDNAAAPTAPLPLQLTAGTDSNVPQNENDDIDTDSTYSAVAKDSGHRRRLKHYNGNIIDANHHWKHHDKNRNHLRPRKQDPENVVDKGDSTALSSSLSATSSSTNNDDNTNDWRVYGSVTYQYFDPLAFRHSGGG